MVTDSERSIISVEGVLGSGALDFVNQLADRTGFMPVGSPLDLYALSATLDFHQAIKTPEELRSKTLDTMLKAHSEQLRLAASLSQPPLDLRPILGTSTISLIARMRLNAIVSRRMGLSQYLQGWMLQAERRARKSLFTDPNYDQIGWIILFKSPYLSEESPRNLDRPWIAGLERQEEQWLAHTVHQIAKRKSISVLEINPALEDSLSVYPYADFVQQALEFLGQAA